MKKYLFIACALFIISCSENRKQSIKDTSVLLKEITDDYYQERMRYFPLEATANTYNRYNDLLPIDISDAYIDTLRQFYHSYSEKLLTINKPELTGQDLISYEVLQYILNTEEEGLKFPSNLMPAAIARSVRRWPSVAKSPSARRSRSRKPSRSSGLDTEGSYLNMFWISFL